MPPRLSIWAPLPPSIHLRGSRSPLPFPLEEPGCRLVAWARHGIWSGVQRLGMIPGDVVLVPAYHHGSEVEALRRSGLECRFYEATTDLEPDRAELERLLDARVRALYLTHVLGFPRDAARWRRWCDERGILLVEDAAQAWLATDGERPVGSSGDLAVWCLYKSVGLSEGAAVLCRPPVDGPGLDPRIGLRELGRRHAMWLAGRSGVAYAASAPFRRPRPYDAARDFELRDPAAGPWRHTGYVLRRTARADVARRRRENYGRLLERLRPLVPPPFDHLPAGASPFVFPFEVEDPETAAATLTSAGVGHLLLWATPHPSLDVGRYPGASRRRERLLGLPVHQELRRADLERIAAAAEAAAGRSRRG